MMKVLQTHTSEGMVVQLKTFIVALDGHEPSDTALSWALAMVVLGGNDLRLVHVIERPAGARLDDCTDTELDEAEQILARAVGRIPEAIRERLGTEILVGPVPQMIAAQAGPGRILTIGSHKTGFLHGRVIGSRGLIIASLVQGMLAVIPSMRLNGRRGVVLGLIAGRESSESAAMAGLHASRFDEEIRLVHAANGNWLLPSHAPTEVDAGRIEVALVTRRLEQDFPALKVRSRISRQEAPIAFLDAARTASLLILPVAYDEHSAQFTGSIAHDVLLNINAPVLLVPSSTVTESAPDDRSGAQARAAQ